MTTNRNSEIQKIDKTYISINKTNRNHLEKTLVYGGVLFCMY